MEQALSPYEISLRFPVRNLVDRIWPDQPALPRGPIMRHPDRFACERVEKKLARIRTEMKAEGGQAFVTSILDEIAWLFNIRGNDSEYNPVVIAHAIVTTRGASLFVDTDRIAPEMRRWMRSFVGLYRYRDFGAALRGLARQRRRVLLDPEGANRWVLGQLKGARVVLAPSPALKAKAVKNPAQIRGMQRAHERDGTALVRFLHWLESLPGRQRWRVSETGAAARLAAFRGEEKFYRGPSFAPIVGWKGNGAIVHYDPAKGGDRHLAGRGLLLFDTGGQYLDGTTDVTRTIVLGQPQRRERELFTRVLQGTIRLSRAVVPEGMMGGRLEVIARQPLWPARADYGHGTGHGVGHYLCVHEGPMGFSTRNQGIIEVGNVLTIEPGHYEAGKFGIRTENMVYVARDGERPRKGQRGWLRFETLTLCPIDLRLVVPAMMEPEEIDWLNAYHQRVRRTLSPRVPSAVRAYLREATRSI
jgi:Xaa-Pro aminopeptidase